MKKIILAFVLTLGIILTVSFIPRVPATAPSQSLGSTADVRFGQSNISTGILATSTSRVLLATSTSRTYAYLVNTSTTTRVFINMSAGAPATTGSGIALMPGQAYEINATNNLYYGAITVISDGTATTTVYER